MGLRGFEFLGLEAPEVFSPVLPSSSVSLRALCASVVRSLFS